MYVTLSRNLKRVTANEQNATNYCWVDESWTILLKQAFEQKQHPLKPYEYNRIQSINIHAHYAKPYENK